MGHIGSEHSRKVSWVDLFCQFLSAKYLLSCRQSFVMFSSHFILDSSIANDGDAEGGERAGETSMV